MKPKDFMWSIVLNGFLGYLWFLFFQNISELTRMWDHFLVKALIFIIGTFLFGEIANRVSPLHEYKWTHPIRIVGAASYLLVVLICWYTK
ncbi:hypothetical protein EJP77_18530 [Paenibacillus zeisoli]|uniref:Uncharacterized protein n=1 Tax=Paenibacillus zeisoli TaxID=2496267 RepID=A0A433X1L9_9BACL|nr:hypothetical protein [Paenibacillus zeisoli]RUT28013.1 hypothetical protein EJP77_18530 [Paenibacillus zeisoli]